VLPYIGHATRLPLQSAAHVRVALVALVTLVALVALVAL